MLAQIDNNIVQLLQLEKQKRQQNLQMLLQNGQDFILKINYLEQVAPQLAQIIFMFIFSRVNNEY